MGFFNRKDKSPARGESRQEDDPNAQALFNSRKNTPQSSSNPYASQTPNPYGSSNPPTSNQKGVYGQPSSDYRGAAPASNPKAAYSGAAGGYGPHSSDPNASALFGNRAPNPNGPPPYSSSSSDPYKTHPNPSSQSSYSTPSNRANESVYSTGSNSKPTESEEEEEEIDDIKKRIHFTKEQSVSSSRHALLVAARAEETGRNTLARLGEQGERLYNTERNLDIARQQNVVAEEKSRELKTVTGSMFAIHLKNPMGGDRRAKEAEEKILVRAQQERADRESNRQAGYDSRNRVNGAMKASYGGGGYNSAKTSVAERSRYQFEGGDEEDDEMENEIDSNLTQLGGVAGRLKALAIATGEETDRQNQKISEIMKKSDRVDDQIAVTHNRIKKIR